MTPEGKVKAKISKYLKTLAPQLWYFMPVPGGFGVRTVDYIGCYKGVMFVIEAKRPGKDATDLQKLTLDTVRRAGGAAFVISDDETLAKFKDWIKSWNFIGLDGEGESD